jgi:hypothetical protein
MLTLLRMLEIAGAVSLTSATIVAFIYAKLKSAENKRLLASKFQHSMTHPHRPSDAAVQSLAMLYGKPRRKH